MKIPSLFGKQPKYQRFSYTPRYYDPKKEEKAAREERIRAEIAREKGEEHAEAFSGHRARMAGAFQQARKRSAPSKEPNIALLRLAILLFIALFLVAFLTWGSIAIYSLFLIFPVYIYLRFFKKQS